MRTIAKILILGLIGCAAPSDGVDVDGTEPNPDKQDLSKDQGDDGKAEGWSTSDSPSGFNASLEYHISRLPTSGQATNIPWASSYWPTYQDNINFKWDGANSDPASTKYGKAFGVSGVENAVSANHGIDSRVGDTSCTSDSQCNDKLGEACSFRAGSTTGRCVATWFGICHAWSPASILTLEPKYPVEYNGVTFKINDIKALVSLVHDRTNTKFVSLRCNKSLTGGEIKFDNYGRPDSASPECKDSNAGAFYVLLTNYLGIKKQAFVEDRTIDFEVWNQPLRGYRVTKIDAVNAATANSLVGVRPTGGTTVNRAASVAAGAWSHQGSFPVTAGSGARVVMTGTGDADLYVSFGAAPTASAYACRPYGGDANETCELAVPAGATQMFVSVNGYSASSYNLAISTGGTLPAAYQFNPAAVFFYNVALEVDYIGESASEQDGNLGATIDRYTHTDKYELVLEANADGNVIGGEWLNGSKQNHPDFVWLPLSSASTSVAGGKITYANVKMLLDKSMNPPGGGSTGGAQEVNESGNVAKSAWKHFGPFNVAPGANLTATMTGSGDADLYVRKAGTPTLTAYDCRPYQSSTAESCTVVGPGAVYVSVNGYAASSDFQLKIKYTSGTGGGGNPPPPSFSHLNQSGSVAQGEMKMFQLPIPAGKKVVIRTTSSVDVDLYILMDGAPTTGSYTDRGYTDSGNETLTFTATSNGVLNIGVHGYAAGSFTVRTSDS